MGIIRGVSESGFEYAIDEDTLKSWDYLEAAVNLQKEDLTDQERMTAIVVFVNILFTGKEKKRFMEHVASIDPVRPPILVLEECNRVISSIKTAKKSTPSQE